MPKKGKNAATASVSDTETETNCLNADNMIQLIDKITSSFTATFNCCVDRIVDTIEKKLAQRMDCQSSQEVYDLHKKD
jgi:hypothetical protein